MYKQQINIHKQGYIYSNVRKVLAISVDNSKEDAIPRAQCNNGANID